jgi:hypothetical protein
MTSPPTFDTRRDCVGHEKRGGEPSELHQRRLDDRKALEAAVSEGWPVPRSRVPGNTRPKLPYRTGSQTWVRRRTTKVQP